MLLIMVLFTMISCENSTENQNTISGNVFYLNGNVPANGAKVFFGNNIFGISAVFFEENTFTDVSGSYSFEKPEETGVCYFYAEKNNGNTDFLSPILTIVNFESFTPIEPDNLYLYPVNEDFQLDGTVSEYEEGNICANNLIKLFELSDGEYILTDSTFSDDNGNYQFPNLPTGNYRISSSKLNGQDYIGVSRYVFFSGLENMVLSLILNEIMEEKPVIYIYSEDDQKFNVKLKLHNETKLTRSIPDYKDGWEVFVEKSGKIDNKYEYLFYETNLRKLPNLFSGWCIKRENIPTELNKILLKLGLNEKEFSDFMEYWLPRFTKYEYYKFQPLINEQLDNFVELDISPEPDSALRLLFFFEGCETFESLPEPKFSNFQRFGTTIVEWGGVMLN